ncbi:tripartite motif containing 71 [Mactra antiquata]
MADDSNLSYSAQQIDELLRCSICLDRLKSPKLLPCQHTFCESPCLQQLVDRFHQIKCPECRQGHRVPYGGVSAFPTNRTILNFLDLPAQARPLPPVPNQTNDTAGDVLAEASGGTGATSNQANNNSPRQGENAQNRENTTQSNEGQRSGCGACSRQLSLSRCPHCDMVICETCKRSHMDQTRLDINRIVSQLRRGIPAFSDAVSVIENKSEQLHQRAEAGKAEITETIERYISELRNRQRLLHSEVQMWLLGEIRSLRMLQENVEVELASTASFCESTESVLQRPNQSIPDDDLVDLRRQCTNHMEIIRGYEGGNAIRLPRERRVEVAFEGNRFSQVISNFGELTVIEQNESESSGNSNINSDPSSLNSRSSSSRESSPAVFGSNSGNNDSSSNINQGRNQSSIDSALLAIGSGVNVSSRPGYSRTGADRDDTGGTSGRHGNNSSSNNGASGHSSDLTPRVTPRERMAGYIAGGSSVAPSPRATRERTAGLMMGGVSIEPGTSSGDNSASERRRNLSWELPVDFSYPPRNDLRVGNGNQSHQNRRSLQERRRHNLSDSGLVVNNRQNNPRRGNETRNQSDRRRNLTRNQTVPSTSSQNASGQDVVASTSAESSERPQGITRSRTFTREEFQAIREEDNVSRASTADPVTRPREPIRFDVDLRGNHSNGDAEETTYRVGNIDGGESTRVNVARNIYQDKGRAIIRFGHRGHNENEFVWPRGLTISRSDQIYVADSSNHRVQVFDNIGTYVKSFGSYGQDVGEFDCLAGITMNTMGEILITDRYNHRVQVFDPSGNCQLEFGEEGAGDGQMSYPWGIACDSMGFIYVCDKENHRIQVFQSNGVFARKFGRLGRQNGQFENPHYLAISSDNKVYVSDCGNHRIQVFSIYGDYIFQFGSIGTMQGQMKHPKGIAIDDQGFVVIADSGNNRIQVFRGDGRFYCMFGSYGSDNGQFKGLEGLAILGNGNVAVCDRENHRVQIF